MWLYQMIAAIIISIINYIWAKNQRVNISHAFAYAIAAQNYGLVLSWLLYIHFVNLYELWNVGLCRGNGKFSCDSTCDYNFSKKQMSYLEAQLEFNLQDCSSWFKIKKMHLFVSIHVPAYKQPHVLTET